MSIPEDHPDDAYLWDMLVRLRELRTITHGKSLDDLLSDRVLQLAVERLIETIGEAARRVSRETQNRHMEIPWRGVIAQRNVIAHDYGSINHHKLWDIIAHHAPRLLTQLESIAPEPPADPLPESDS